MDIVTFVLIHDYARYLQTSHELIQRERFPDGIIQAFVEGNPDLRRVGRSERLLARLPLSARSVPVHLLQRVAHLSFDDPAEKVLLDSDYRYYLVAGCLGGSADFLPVYIKGWIIHRPVHISKASAKPCLPGCRFP